MEEEKKYYGVAEVAEKLGKELRVNVTESRIRRFENDILTDVKRTEGNEYRQFSEDDIEKLRMIIALTEIGIGVDVIKAFLDEPINAKLIISLIERASALESILVLIRNYIGKIGESDKAGGIR